MDTSNLMYFVSPLASSTATLASLLLMYQHFTDYSTERMFRSGRDINDESLDFVLVGGGTSGSMLAHRLVESGFSVLILEAGGDPISLLEIPVLFNSLQNSEYNNYKYQTIPQKFSSRRLRDKKSYWPAGKGVGGTSNFNALIWTKGHTKDYDNWADITGDPGWKYENLESYFDRTLQNIHVSENPSAIGEVFLKAVEELGYPVLDTNQPYDSAGFNHIKFNTRNGLRSGVYQELIKPLLNNPNLTIRKFSTVSKIVFNADNEAVGVEYRRFENQHFVKSSKEVIICAGAVETPKLLMLSSIGPKEHLEQFNIPVRVDLPVGKNLQDHFFSLVQPFTIEVPLSFDIEDLNFQTIIDYSTKGQGVLASTGYSATGFVTTNIARKRGEDNWPDLQLMLAGASVSNKAIAKIVEDRCNIQDDFLSTSFSYAFGKNSFTLTPVLVRPQSRGQILLKSTNAFDSPEIDPTYLSHDDDVKVLIEGMKIIMNLTNNTSAFRSVGIKIHEEPLEGCENHGLFSPQYFECYARTLGVSGAHASGTCAMGKANDPNAVVDSKLRVFGTKRLRVVDASVFPTIPNANIFWPCLMIAEKAADFLINDYS